MGFKLDSYRLLLLERSWSVLRQASNCMRSRVEMEIWVWKWCNELEIYRYNVTSLILIRTRCGETAELEGWEPIIKTPPHLAHDPKGICETDRCRLEDRKKRVRECDRLAWCKEPHKLRGSMKAQIINTPPHVAQHPKGIRETERCRLEHRKKRVRECDRLAWCKEPHKLRGSMKAQQECVTNETNCADLCTLYKSTSDQALGKIQCGFCCILRCCLSAPVSSKYILPIAQSISVIPPCISIRPTSASPSQTEWWWWREIDFPVTSPPWTGPNWAQPVQDWQSAVQSSPAIMLNWTGWSQISNGDCPDWWNHWA